MGKGGTRRTGSARVVTSTLLLGESLCSMEVSLLFCVGMWVELCAVGHSAKYS